MSGPRYRPHQGIGNVLLPEYADDPPDILLFPTKNHPESVVEFPGNVVCQEWLGGKLRHYYRQAA